MRVANKTSCLYLAIGMTFYRLDRLREGIRLTKPCGENYVVHVNQYGPDCTCADCNFRQRVCKHIKALKEQGIL